MIKNDSRPVYTYGMPFRGFGPGCQPKQGLIDAKDTDRVKTGLWSIVTYSRPLTESEISEYELVPIPDNQGNLPQETSPNSGSPFPKTGGLPYNRKG